MDGLTAVQIETAPTGWLSHKRELNASFCKDIHTCALREYLPRQKQTKKILFQLNNWRLSIF